MIALTSSSAEDDILEAHRAHAAGYVTKPVCFDGFLTFATPVCDFWMASVTVPSASLDVARAQTPAVPQAEPA